MKRLFTILGLTVVTSLLLVSSVGAAMKVPPQPANGWYVLDQTNTLSSEEIDKLNKQIDNYLSSANVQFGVLMVPKIENGEYLERFSLNVAREWGIGEKGENNGALLLIAKDDRRMRIEVGTGLEGDLTDTRAARIIEQRIAPEFRKGNYYAGIESGLSGMALAVNKEADTQLTEQNSDNTPWFEIIMGFAFAGFAALSWLGAILGRSKRWWPGGILGGIMGVIGGLIVTPIAIAAGIGAAIGLFVGLGFDFLVSRNYQAAKKHGHHPAWWAGGTSLGGGGGGSGGGFGGGSFGGGGASGGW